MSREYFSSVLDAPVDPAWSVVADFRCIGRWVNRIPQSRSENGIDPGSVGPVRHLVLEPDGRQIGEQLVRYDRHARLYSYEFVDSNPDPVNSYVGTLHLLPVTANDQTLVAWLGDFDADSAVVDRLTMSFIEIYSEFDKDLAHQLATVSATAG